MDGWMEAKFKLYHSHFLKVSQIGSVNSFPSSVQKVVAV